MRIVTGICTKKACPGSEPFSQAIFLGENQREWILECQECGTEFKKPAPMSIKTGPHYPYYSESLGVTVQDRDHEKSYAKANGFIEQDWTRNKRPKKSHPKKRR